MNIYLARILVLSSLVSLLTACVSSTTQLYRGDMELVTISGDSCTDIEKQLRLELVLRQKSSTTGQQVTGYLSGPEIQAGKLSGNTGTQLQVLYPDEADTSAQEHTLLLTPATDGMDGELHEKPRGNSGCYFEHAVLKLKHIATGSEANSAFDLQQKLFEADTLFHKGQNQLKANNPEEALRDLTESQRLRTEVYPIDSKSSYLLFSVATAHMMAGRTGNALDILRSLLNDKMYSETETRQMRLGVIRNLCAFTYEAKDDIRQKSAEQLLDGLAHDYSGQHEEGAVLAECYRELGQDQISQGDPDQSIDFFQKALVLNPNDAESIGGIVIGNIERETPAEGRTFLEKHAQIIIDKTGRAAYDDGLSNLFALEAKLAEREQDYTRAEQLLQDALKINANERGLIISLSRVQEKLGKPDEAQKLLEVGSSMCSNEACRLEYAKELTHQKQIESIVKRLNEGLN